MPKANPLRRWVPLVVIVLALAAALATFVGSCATTLFDNDRYGKVSVPGDGTVELKEPTAIISYENRVSLPSDTSIDAPDDLRITVRSAETGERVRLEREDHLRSYDYNDLHGTSVARAFVPEDGEYRVAVRRTGGGGGGDEAITFGPDLSVGELFARTGLIVAAGLVLALLLWLLGTAIGRARGEGPLRRRPRPPTPPGAVPPAAPPAATTVSPASEDPGSVSAADTPAGAAGVAPPPPSAGAPAPPPPAPAPPASAPAQSASGPAAQADPAAQLAALEDERRRTNMSDEDYEARRKRIIEGI